MAYAGGLERGGGGLCRTGVGAAAAGRSQRLSPVTAWVQKGNPDAGSMASSHPGGRSGTGRQSLGCSVAVSP